MPVAVTVKLTLPPRAVVWAEGWEVTTGLPVATCPSRHRVLTKSAVRAARAAMAVAIAAMASAVVAAAPWAPTPHLPMAATSPRAQVQIPLSA